MYNVVLYMFYALWCTLCYLLQIELPLNVLEVTRVIGDGFGQLGLDVGQPGAKAAHILIQLLHGHQSFSQLLHSMNIITLNSAGTIQKL